MLAAPGHRCPAKTRWSRPSTWRALPKAFRLLVLPPSYRSLSEAGQLLALANSERSARGLPGFVGLSSPLDTRAQEGAAANDDPIGPPGAAWATTGPAARPPSCWPTSTGSTTTASGPPCWDHRQNVLGDYGAHPLMGAAAIRVDGVTSMTELFASSRPAHRAVAAH